MLQSQGCQSLTATNDEVKTGAAVLTQAAAGAGRAGRFTQLGQASSLASCNLHTPHPDRAGQEPPKEDRVAS